jgi:hypothetical protein
MATALKSKPGITTANTLSIPKDWDAAWFRSFIANKLQGSDVRNAVGANGIVVSGTLASPYATISIGGSGPVTLPGPVTVTGGGLIIGTPTGGNEGAGTVNATNYYLSGVQLFQSGTFTGTLTGMTGIVTGTVTYTISGSICTLTASFTGTSNSVGMTMTGLPAACQPASARQFAACSLLDNGSNCASIADIQAGSGTINFGRGVVSGTALTYATNAGFTASGSKGFNVTTITYSLK